MDPDFDFNKSLKHVTNSRKAQRNWDHSKIIPKKAVQHLIDVATNSPAKQDEVYFDLYVVTNREKLHELYLNHSWGFNVDVDKNYRNPQVDAHALFIWARKKPDTHRNSWVNHDDKTTEPFSRAWTNCLASIGISAGMTALVANQMGLTTAFNKAFFFQPDSYDAWIEAIDHKEPCHPEADPKTHTIGQSSPAWRDPWSGEVSTIVQALGVGYPDKSIAWYQSRDTQYISSDPKDDIGDLADGLNMQGIVHNEDVELINFSAYSHDIKTDQPIKRPYKINWIK